MRFFTFLGFTYRQNAATVNHKIKERDKEMTNRIKLTKDIRMACFARDDWTCRACGHHDTTGASLQGDHIIAVTNGGKNELANLQTLCGVCNNAKQNTDLKLKKRAAPSMTQTLGEYLNMVNENRDVFYRTLKQTRMKKNRKARA